jgi:hypothetical protein
VRWQTEHGEEDKRRVRGEAGCSGARGAFYSPGGEPRGLATFNGDVQLRQFQILKMDERGVMGSAHEGGELKDVAQRFDSGSMEHRGRRRATWCGLPAETARAGGRRKLEGHGWACLG